MKKRNTRTRKLWLWLVIILLSPIALFMFLATLVYLPPVQNFVVHRVAERLSVGMGWHVSVDRVRLAFPLDLAVHDVCITDRTDTLVAARSLRLDVRLMPLFSGRADIDGFCLYKTKINSKELIPNTYIRGHVGRLEARSHGVEWPRGKVRLEYAALNDARLYVALSDTAKQEPDTARAMPWHIVADRINISHSAVSLSLPGDSLRLSMEINQAGISDADFDTGRPRYAVGRLSFVDSRLTYIARNARQRVGALSLGNAAFVRNNVLLWPDFVAKPGIDPAYISISGLGLRLDSVSYDRSVLQAAIKKLAFRERSGLVVSAAEGHVYMDSLRLCLPKFTLRTPASELRLTTDMPFAALSDTASGSQLRAELSLRLGAADVQRLGQDYLPSEVLKAWPRLPLSVEARVTGNMRSLHLAGIRLSWPQVLTVTAGGTVADALSDRRLVKAQFSLLVTDAKFIKAFLPVSSRGSFDIPRGTMARGKFSMQRNRYEIDARVAAGRGHASVNAEADLERERYAVELRAETLPLGHILPGLGLNDFSGRLAARGYGFDVLSPASRLEAEAQVGRFNYARHELGGLSLTAKSKGGKALVTFASNNPLVEGNGTLTASLGKQIQAHLQADLPVVDMFRLGLVKDTVQVGAAVDISYRTNRSFTAYDLAGGIRQLRFMTPDRGIPAKDIDFDFATSPDTTTAGIMAGDLALNLGAKGELGRMFKQFGHFATLAGRQLKERTLDHEMLKRTFPVVDFSLKAGSDNPLGRILYYKGISYNTLSLRLSANPKEGIDGALDVGALKQGNLLLDTIHLSLFQDTAAVHLDGYARNYTRRNPNKFELLLFTYLQQSQVGAQVQFIDEKGRKGIDLGLRANAEEEGLRVSLFPVRPIIAYRNFDVNADNYIFLGKHKQVEADVNLVADDGTALSIHGEPSDSVNDLTVNLANLNVGELCNVMPYLPRMSGMLNGDLHVIDDHANGSLSTAAQLSARSFVYDGAPIGDVGIEAVYLPKAGGEHYANAYISAGNAEVMQCEGTYYDADGHFSGTAHLTDCPLKLINGFMAGSDIALDGRAGGQLAINGTVDAPAVTGTLNLDSSRLYSQVYGFSFDMDERPVEIKDSRLILDQFGLYSAGEKNPLVLDGTLDFSDFSRITMDFNMRANNFKVINAPRNAASMVFGKVYANYAGTLRGTTDNLSIRGKLDVLDRTDMTYVLKDSPLTVDDRLHDLVRFVDFRDTATVIEDGPITVGGFDMTLGISISDAARFRCNLSDDGSNYVNLEGGGDLTMRLTQQGEMRLTGRFTANSGDMKYSLPVIPLKTFDIVQGSYVDFTGDVANPTLNITAKERVRATVTENDQPRSVSFDVGVAITQPLDKMGLEFIIEAPEDLSVQNQLATMSRDQRSKTAVAMLATGMYVTDDLLSSSSTGGLKASNALNAFLQSEIQSIAGSALKTIDVTVGMESGTSSAGTETTDYSFQFAKRFWNNRVSVIIGGKVSTGQDAQNSAESFIDNIAIEYRLDKSATRYVKVFYDRSTQDPLEGQLTRTGAGLVLRRKTDRLGDLFIFTNRKRKPASSSQQPAD